MTDEHFPSARAKGVRPGSDYHKMGVDLMTQWLQAHAQDCGPFTGPWPHEGTCRFPLPPALERHSDEEINYLIEYVREPIDFTITDIKVRNLPEEKP